MMGSIEMTMVLLESEQQDDSSYDIVDYKNNVAHLFVFCYDPTDF